MSILDQLTQDMKEAMKAKDSERLSAIRLMRNELKNASINQGKELSEDDEIAVLSSAAKRRKESIQAYTDAGRDDLAEKEQRELDIIQTYLPRPLAREELESIVVDAIRESGAESVKDLGKVMPLVMKQAKGRADGKQVNQLVRDKLGG
ncbi:MAG: GatB/YqeY domain-containing protein [candidate division KSB1 bacterium]|nr:GatB/YqeY domain-containing protein [candidate division KSB1 bacterium]